MTIENQYGLRLSLCIEEVMNRLERSGACEEDNPWNETFASLAVLLSIVQKEEDDECTEAEDEAARFAHTEECEEGHDYY